MENGIKYDMDDKDIQSLSEHLKYLINEKYKEELSSVPDHIKNTLCQNYVIQCKKNQMDLDSLLKEAGISD